MDSASADVQYSGEQKYTCKLCHKLDLHLNNIFIHIPGFQITYLFVWWFICQRKLFYLIRSEWIVYLHLFLSMIEDFSTVHLYGFDLSTWWACGAQFRTSKGASKLIWIHTLLFFNYLIISEAAFLTPSASLLAGQFL